MVDEPNEANMESPRSTRANDFDVDNDDFAQLSIQPGDDHDSFHYFYQAGDRRLIKHFRLRDGPQVDTLCAVILIKKDEGYTPRLRFWKRDKTKPQPNEPNEVQLAASAEFDVAKASVDLNDCHENLWKVIEYLRSVREVTLPPHEFRVAHTTDALLAQSLEGHDKTSVLTAVQARFGTELSERDVQMLIDRKATLSLFERMLSDRDFFQSERSRLGGCGPEKVWEQFFEENPWIFGYGLALVSCEAYDKKRLEQTTTGAGLFTGGGKRSDAVMKTRGFIQSLLFGEFKHHETDLLMANPYREPDVYQASKELSGAVSQVQKTAHKAIRDLEDLHRQHNPGGDYEFEVSTIKPRQVVLIGTLDQLGDDGGINVEKLSSFELYRRNQQEIEILTFDELLARARFIVQQHDAERSASAAASRPTIQTS